jgi:adenosylmethionine-8-amino-7-oxononanoate aminotransferase
MLLDNVSRVSACNTYRGMRSSETVEGYVERLAQELDDEFQRVGPDTVCAFVAEPVVGAVSIYYSQFAHIHHFLMHSC